MKIRVLYIVVLLNLIALSAHAGWWSDIAEKKTEWVQIAKEKWNSWVGNVKSYFGGEEQNSRQMTAGNEASEGTTARGSGNTSQRAGTSDPSRNIAFVPSQESVQAKKSWGETKTFIQTQAPIKVGKKGIAASKELSRTKSGIPYIESRKLQAIKKMKVPQIPLLSIGTEDELDPLAFQVSPMVALPKLTEKEVRELDSPKEFQFKSEEPIMQAQGPEQISIPKLEPEKRVTLESVKSLNYQTQQDRQIALAPLRTFTEEELKLLRGLIFYEAKEQCHLAAGLFSELAKSQNPEVRAMSLHHLGHCLSEMKIPSESTHYLTQVTKGKEPRFTTDALRHMLRDNSFRTEEIVVDALEETKDSNLWPQEMKSQIDYLRSKVAIRKGHYDKGLKVALQVPSDAKEYYKAQYLAAVAEHLLGNTEASLSRQAKLVEALKGTVKEKDVLTLAQINLARIAFQKGKFKESADAFQKVPKEHPLWLSSLMELGWAQVQSKDASGTIGNMHSIQSPYFEAAYKAESYVLRTIGYLDICQYGDAHRTLTYFEQKYGPWYQKMDRYLDTKKDSGASLYQATVKYLGNMKSTQDVDGLPYQVVRELARRKDFLNAQESVNQTIDDKEGLNFISSLIEKDRKAYALKRSQLAKSQKDLFEILGFKLEVLAESERDFKNYKALATSRLQQTKEKWQTLAAQDLRKHLRGLKLDLERALANNELLRYEVYAGSGENIRTHMAGTPPTGYVPGQKVQIRQLTKQEIEKNRWEFEGEFWEDEIGHYRSGLKNNCGPRSVARE